jgi:hypothetical protein
MGTNGWGKRSNGVGIWTSHMVLGGISVLTFLGTLEVWLLLVDGINFCSTNSTPNSLGGYLAMHVLRTLMPVSPRSTT